MMSKCPHCNGMLWELETEEPRGSAFKINFIRCAGCKAPVGTMEYFNLHSDFEVLQKEVKKLEQAINSKSE